MNNQPDIQKNDHRPKLLWVGPLSSIGGITVITKRFLKDQNVHTKYQVKVQDQVFFGRWNELGLLRPLKLPLGVIKIIWNMIFFSPDIVHVHTSYRAGFMRDALIILIAHYLGAKTVMTFHSGRGGTLMNNYYQGPAGLKRLTQFTLPRIDALIANGKSYEIFLSGEFNHKNIHIIPNPVDNDFTPKDAPPYRERENIVFFAGFLDARKGVFDLLKAAELMPDARFIIYGTASNMRPFQEALKRCSAKDRIILDNGYGVEKVIQYMGKARVLALPSYGETLPLILEEAIVSGLPVVTTPVGVITDYVQDGIHGHLIEPGDIEGLVQALDHILNNKEWAAYISENNRSYGEIFFSSNVNEKHLLLYDDLL